MVMLKPLRKKGDIQYLTWDFQLPKLGTLSMENDSSRKLSEFAMDLGCNLQGIPGPPRLFSSGSNGLFKVGEKSYVFSANAKV